jgi:hypothetical protein
VSYLESDCLTCISGSQIELESLIGELLILAIHHTVINLNVKIMITNPSLREEPRQQKAPIIESRVDSSIVSWLEGTGRLMERDPVAESPTTEEIDDELSTSLIGNDDYEEDDYEEEED